VQTSRRRLAMTRQTVGEISMPIQSNEFLTRAKSLMPFPVNIESYEIFFEIL
jgi:hypothetical protein